MNKRPTLLRIDDLNLGDYIKFRTIPGFDYYKISRCGDYIYNVKSRFIVRQHPNKAGYLKVTITDSKNNRKNSYVHRLVAFAWKRVPKRLSKLPKKHLYINHINHIKTDNHADNIEYVSPKENSAARDINKKKNKNKEKCLNKSILLGILPKKR